MISISLTPRIRLSYQDILLYRVDRSVRGVKGLGFFYAS